MNPLINNGNRPMTFGQLYAQVMKNPRAFLDKLGIPQDITTPQGAVQYLLQSGKTTQAEITQAQQKAGQIDINKPI